MNSRLSSSSATFNVREGERGLSLPLEEASSTISLSPLSHMNEHACALGTGDEATVDSNHPYQRRISTRARSKYLLGIVYSRFLKLAPIRQLTRRASLLTLSEPTSIKLSGCAVIRTQGTGKVRLDLRANILRFCFVLSFGGLILS